MSDEATKGAVSSDNSTRCPVPQYSSYLSGDEEHSSSPFSAG